MDKKPTPPASPESQGAERKSDEASSTAESAFEFSATGTKPKKVTSPVRVPPTSRMIITHRIVVPEEGATGFSCSGIELPADSKAEADHKTTSVESAQKNVVTKPEPETNQSSTDSNKPPVCTRPAQKDTVDYYEALNVKIEASIRAVESSPPSKTFWEATGAVPKYTTRTPPKVLPPPFKRTPTPTKRKVKVELFKSVFDPVGTEPGEQKLEEPPKDPQSCSAEAKSPAEARPKRRNDFKDDDEWIRYTCRDFQDYKRTVNNRQKGTEYSLNQLLPVMNSAMLDAQRLATKISKVRDEVCGTESDLRVQNDKLKYLLGRTMAILAKIDDILERFRADILTYTTLTLEGNEGIDMRLRTLVMLIGGVREKDFTRNYRGYHFLRDALKK